MHQGHKEGLSLAREPRRRIERLFFLDRRSVCYFHDNVSEKNDRRDVQSNKYVGRFEMKESRWSKLVLPPGRSLDDGL